MKLRLLFLGLFLALGTMFTFASSPVSTVKSSTNANQVQPAVKVNEAAKTITLGKKANAKMYGSFYFIDCNGNLWYVEYWGMDQSEAIAIADFVTCYMI